MASFRATTRQKILPMSAVRDSLRITDIKHDVMHYRQIARAGFHRRDIPVLFEVGRNGEINIRNRAFGGDGELLRACKKVTSGSPMCQPSTNFGAVGMSSGSPSSAPPSTHATMTINDLSLREPGGR